MPRVLHHLTLWVPDIERSESSWRWLLGELGYRVDRSIGGVVLFRHVASRFSIALENSADMVPGMLYSRMRPGLNHLAFAVESRVHLTALVEAAPERGWRILPSDRHPIAGGATVAYLEDANGFEIELVGPTTDGTPSDDPHDADG